MDFWQTTQKTSTLSAPRVPKQEFSDTLMSVYDQPGYGQAFAELTNANRRVRIQKKTGPNK
jgi:hypothetical protein